jgi:hypothetical protein
VNAAFSSGSFSTQSFSVLAFAFEDQKKPGGSSGYDDWSERHAAAMRLARMDQQDLLDIVTILGFIDIEEL